MQFNKDIRELSRPEKKYLISGFGLFCLGNTGSNLGLEKISYISAFLLYQGLLYPGYTVDVRKRRIKKENKKENTNERMKERIKKILQKQ